MQRLSDQSIVQGIGVLFPYVLLSMLCLLYGGYLSAQEGPAEPGQGKQYRDWKLVTDKKGIKVYQAHTADSKFKTFRGVAKVHYDDLSVIPVILDDYDYLDDWMHMITEISELKRITNQERELYVKTELPWPVKDRDGVVTLTFEQDPETYAVFIRYHSIKDERYGEREGYIRMPTIVGVFSFEPIPDSLDILATFEVIMDPGGYIPAFLSNMIMDDIPYFTLDRMRRVVNMERYKGKNYDYIERRPWVAGNEVAASKRPE